MSVSRHQRLDKTDARAVFLELIRGLALVQHRACAQLFL